MSTPQSKVVYRTCNVCEAMCGLAVTVDGGKVTDIRGDKEDVFSRGHVCPKGPAMREVLDDPDRLRRPVRRTATGWQEIGWPEALAEAADRLGRIRSEHGKDAIGVYAGNPTAHNHGAILAIQGFAKALGTRNRFDANSQDANPKLFSSMLMFGDITSIPIPDVDRTDYFLVLGANPAASMGSLMTLGDVRGRCFGGQRARGRGAAADRGALSRGAGE
jgi:anaerobic selenocysteine-containing dehydrogenase